jgi:hypothetical protein
MHFPLFIRVPKLYWLPTVSGHSPFPGFRESRADMVPLLLLAFQCILVEVLVLKDLRKEGKVQKGLKGFHFQQIS